MDWHNNITHPCLPVVVLLACYWVFQMRPSFRHVDEGGGVDADVEGEISDSEDEVSREHSPIGVLAPVMMMMMMDGWVLCVPGTTP